MHTDIHRDVNSYSLPISQKPTSVVASKEEKASDKERSGCDPLHSSHGDLSFHLPSVGLVGRFAAIYPAMSFAVIGFIEMGLGRFESTTVATASPMASRNVFGAGMLIGIAPASCTGKQSFGPLNVLESV